MDLVKWVNPKNNAKPPNKVKVKVTSGARPFFISQNSEPVLFSENDTFGVVKAKYQDLYISDAEKLKEIKFYGRNGQIQNKEILKNHMVKMGMTYMCMIRIQFKVNGGAENDEEEPYFDWRKKPKYRIRNIDYSDGICKKSEKECIISLEKDNNNVYLPCKHTINSQSMFRYLLKVFNSNDWQYKIYCPVPKCQKALDFDYCGRIACLNESEWVGFFEEIMKRSTPPSKECPNCDNLCEKSERLTLHRVVCICSKDGWCWSCGKKWIGEGVTVCGNSGCTTNDINEILKNCGTTMVTGDIEVPALRACPSCYRISEHAAACKHVNCKGCNAYFCYVCLRVATNENGKIVWNCAKGKRDYAADCGVKPRQVLK